MPNPALSTLDLVSLIMDSEVRRLDFAVLLHFDREIDANDLARGALSARRLYSTTACNVVHGRWCPLEPDSCELAFRSLGRGESKGLIEQFLRRPFDLASGPPLRQAWVRDAETGNGCLVTKVHHCVADLLSVLAWIRHQLRVASDLERPCSKPAAVVPPALAQAPPGAKRNPAWDRCAPLWTRPGEASGEKRWTTSSFSHGELAGISLAECGFTLNDVLVVAALETLQEWNRIQGYNGRRVGIWLPVNIRRDAFEGFGNASSRIRIRRDYADGLDIADKCRAVRSQINLARERGEWIVPRRTLLTGIPLRFSAPLVRRYLNRPWADMGSAAFSHVQKWPGQDDPVFAGLRELGVLGAMHRRHALIFAAVSLGERTWMTITYDPALLWPEDIAIIRDRYLSTVEAASRGL
ncbi:MAG: hypothetical protein F4Y47_19170 [Acidobacteriia bacterium]|nr:hypothetical protein [Terriglobia bacterium]MYG02225.1 hypothetical protein [Terriglobia bacterium]MYK10303.1 hypothetical protein [Terriglobia bacterium]